MAWLCPDASSSFAELQILYNLKGWTRLHSNMKAMQVHEFLTNITLPFLIVNTNYVDSGDQHYCSPPCCHERNSATV